MKLYKYVIFTMRTKDHYIQRFRLLLEDKMLIWVKAGYGKSYRTKRQAELGLKMTTIRHKHIISGKWTVFATEAELRRLSGLTDDAPIMAVRDKVMELLQK